MDLYKTFERSSTSFFFYGYSPYLRDVVSKHEVYENRFRFQNSHIATSCRFSIICGESRYMYERQPIRRQSFRSSSFSYRVIELNSIRSLSYVFLSGSLLDMMVWMRWYSMLERQKVSFDAYVGFIYRLVCVKVNLACINNVMLIIAMYAKYEK